MHSSLPAVQRTWQLVSERPASEWCSDVDDCGPGLSDIAAWLGGGRGRTMACKLGREERGRGGEDVKEGESKVEISRIAGKQKA